MENLILVGHIVFGFASFVGSLLLTIGFTCGTKSSENENKIIKKNR